MLEQIAPAPWLAAALTPEVAYTAAVSSMSSAELTTPPRRRAAAKPMPLGRTLEPRTSSELGSAIVSLPRSALREVFPVRSPPNARTSSDETLVPSAIPPPATMPARLEERFEERMDRLHDDVRELAACVNRALKASAAPREPSSLPAEARSGDSREPAERPSSWLDETAPTRPASRERGTDPWLDETLELGWLAYDPTRYGDDDAAESDPEPLWRRSVASSESVEECVTMQQQVQACSAILAARIRARQPSSRRGW